MMEEAGAPVLMEIVVGKIDEDKDIDSFIPKVTGHDVASFLSEFGRCEMDHFENLNDELTAVSRGIMKELFVLPRRTAF